MGPIDEREYQDFRHVRDSSFYGVPRRANWTEEKPAAAKLDAAKRKPIEKNDRVRAEKQRLGQIAEGDANSSASAASGNDVPKVEGSFWENFDSWVDKNYSDRLAATKVKVGFRKEYKRIKAGCNLCTAETIAAELQKY